MLLARTGIIASSSSGGVGEYWMSYLSDSYSPPSTSGKGIAVDSLDNIYSTGHYKNTSGGLDVFVVKQDKNGAVQWQRSINGPRTASSQNDVGISIFVDNSDNVYATGFIKVSAGSSTLFIVKYNSSGVIQWQRSLTSTYTSPSSQGNAVTVDGSGNVYVAGYFINSSGSASALLAKYDSSGTLQWQRSLTLYLEYAWGLITDSSGNIYVVGELRTSSTVANTNVFVVKYDSSGTLQWQRKLADGNAVGSQSDIAYAVTADNSNNIYVTGRYKNNSSKDLCFIAKYNSSGTLQWKRSLESTTGNRGTGIAIDPTNQYIYITTYDGSKSFIAQYDLSGTIQWQRSLATAKNGSIVIDSTGAICTVGDFTLTSGTNAYIIRLANDGSGTGTYTLGTGRTLTYAVSSLTDATATTLTDSAASLTSATSSLTAATSTYTDAALSLSSNAVTV